MNSKKIGTFLMAMLVLCAVLILLATPQDASAGNPAEPVQTTAPGEPTGSTELPEAEQPLDSLPDGTTPAQTTEPAPEQTSDASAQVKRILEEHPLNQTAVTRYSPVDTGPVSGAEGRADASAAHALAQMAQSRRMNPIAAFWLLESEGIYDKREDQSGLMKTAAFQVPWQEAKQYAYTDEGASQLLTDLLALAADMGDELGLEQAVLEENLRVEADQVFFSESDGCRYAYFSCSSEYTTHILCFYLRGDARGEQICDVEFQLLSMRHADGEDAALEMLDGHCDRQAAGLMAAAELLMTGSTQAGEGWIAFEHHVGSYQSKLQRYEFTAEGEQGSLINYRLRAK